MVLLHAQTQDLPRTAPEPPISRRGPWLQPGLHTPPRRLCQTGSRGSIAGLLAWRAVDRLRRPRRARSEMATLRLRSLDIGAATARPDDVPGAAEAENLHDGLGRCVGYRRGYGC